MARFFPYSVYPIPSSSTPPDTILFLVSGPEITEPTILNLADDCLTVELA